jgi:hypothetical protein
MSEEAPTYKIGIAMCTGTEHVHVEELPNATESNGRSGFGALANQTINGASWFVMKDFLREYACKKNQEDDTYLNEGQLRQLWKDFVL